MKDHLRSKGQIQYRPKNFSLNSPKGQIVVGESFEVCVEGPGGYSDCKTLTNSLAKQTEEVTFSID